MSAFRTSELAESTQMKPAHETNPGATSRWRAHKKPSLTVLFQAQPPRCPSVGKCFETGVTRRDGLPSGLRSCLLSGRIEPGTKCVPWWTSSTRLDATISLTWVRWRAWNWSTVDCSNTLRLRTRSRRSQLGQCKTFLRQQLLSRPGATRRCDRMRVVSAVRMPNSKIYERDQRHKQLAPALAWRPRLPQLWSEVFFLVQVVAAARTAHP